MKRGQAALEFLSTYAWAILVVLIAMGAMYYLGWEPTGFLPSKCVVDQPFACTQAKVSTAGEIYLELQYLIGTPIESLDVEISTLNCELDTSTWTETGMVSQEDFLNDHLGGSLLFECDPSTNLRAGDRFLGQILITYTRAESTIERTIFGSFEQIVEP